MHNSQVEKDNSQHCSLWVEWFHGVDLVEHSACVHQDLPDVVVIASAREHEQKYQHLLTKHIKATRGVLGASVDLWKVHCITKCKSITTTANLSVFFF